MANVWDVPVAEFPSSVGVCLLTRGSGSIYNNVFLHVRRLTSTACIHVPILIIIQYKYIIY